MIDQYDILIPLQYSRTRTSSCSTIIELHTQLPYVLRRVGIHSNNWNVKKMNVGIEYSSKYD